MFVSASALARLDGGAKINPDILIIQFHEKSLTRYTGGIDGLNATAPSVTGERIDPDSADSLAYRDYLRQRQDRHLNEISASLGRQVDVVFRYDIMLNGVAVRARKGDYAKVRKVPGVKAVAFDRIYPLDTDRGPYWIGADGIWDGSGTGGLGDTRGEDIVIGVLDTGVNFGHPSYSDMPDDGHTYTNPNGSGNFLGWCDPGHPMWDPSYRCNDKLIGAWDYSDALGPENDGPVDDDGHGSHTSSTAGGNTLTSPAISGVAPHANIIMYDVCFEDPPGTPDGCPLAATSAAAEQAIIDGVDVINYSIGGGSIPWSAFDIDSFFLDLVAADAFVSASAGNAGPGASTNGHNGPWVATIGASTHDREGVEIMLVDMAGGGTPPADITGQSRTNGYGPETIVYAGDFSNGDPDPEQCLNPFPPGTWTSGEIVLCDRGTIARVLKCAHVAAGGAGGCILANVPGSGDPVADPHVIPSIHVDLTAGNALRSWLASGSGHMGEITDSTVIVNPAVADIMASFSSRGPNTINVIKPDLTNPGVNIFAAVQAGSVPGFSGPDFGTLSGTSMSSPHTAGSAALLMALHPTWTPTEVKSALMTTAVTTVFKEDGTTPADPFDIGSGRVDLGAASQAGLILDETEANFLAANPGIGGRPQDLNLASMMETRCAVACSFTRTVKNARTFNTGWTFAQTAGADFTVTATPNAFTLPPGATQVIEFDIAITGGSNWLFGEGTFTENSALASPAHFTIAVQNAALSIGPIDIESLEQSGMIVLEDTTSIGATDLQLAFAGVVPLPRTRDEVEEDPTNGDAFDDDLGTVTWWLNGVSNGRRLHASTLESEAPDLDLFVGRDLNGDDIPQANEVVCMSTSPVADESCEIPDPEDGDWFVRVQNWQGSGNPTDAFTARFAVVGENDEGNFSASTSNSSPGVGEPFDVTINWNFGPNGGSGHFIGVMDVGSSPGNPNDLGTIRVDFHNARLVLTGFE
jgi:subtilisin family serine protease